MSKIIQSLACVLMTLFPLTAIANDFDLLYKNAEELYGATLYAEAAEKYVEMRDALERVSLSAKVDISSNLALCCCRLGQISFYLADYSKAKHYFETPRAAVTSLPVDAQLLEMQAAYLNAVSCRRLGLHEDALRALERHADIAFANNLLPHPESIYEKGLIDFLMGNYSAAKMEFQKISIQNPSLELYILSQMYLGRIAMAEGATVESDILLEKLAGLIPEGDALHYEVNYLRGESAFLNGNFQSALAYFDLSLPKRNPTSAPWHSEALIRLGRSHLEIAKAQSNLPEIQKIQFSKAEGYFHQALQLERKESYQLELAQCLIAKSHYLKDSEALNDARKLLDTDALFHSLDVKAESLLLRAEIAPDYASKEKIYRQLTNKIFRGTPSYAPGWHRRGLNSYARAEASNGMDSRAFKRCTFQLKRAFNLAVNEADLASAAIAIKYLIRAHLLEGSRKSKKTALKLIENFIAQKTDILSCLTESEEIFYLQGLTACRLGEAAETDVFTAIAEKALWRVVNDAPRGRFADESLYLLGSFYFRQGRQLQSQEAFLHLVAHYPDSSYAAEALHYCAENAEKLGQDPELIKNYREQLYKNYGDSLYAPPAYFHYYSYSEYLQGNKEALKHLRSFLDIYPNSLSAINAYYLLGLDYKRDRKTLEGRSISKRNLFKAIEAFTEVEKQFEVSFLQKQIPEGDLHFYVTLKYRAMLERALANHAISAESQSTKRDIYYQYAEELFKQMNRELADGEHPFASHLIKAEPLPRIFEESLNALTEIYLSAGQDEEARKLIEEMLQKYHRLGISKGYYLSRNYYELGLLDMKRHEYELAWQSFMRAEDSSKGKFLSTDQKLDLWIQQSLCYKALGQIDKAMLILSKVINDDAVSGLRLKAMYLRAEVYEHQGRPELARKQLEAIAKKGGEWAHKAKNKLDNEYGF